MPSKKVAHKKIPETDAIFDHLASVNATADADEGVLRLSLDAKASIWVGDYSRGGTARVTVKALDHDFQPDDKMIPFGICHSIMRSISISRTLASPVTLL